jgi:hypothetical protein
LCSLIVVLNTSFCFLIIICHIVRKETFLYADDSSIMVAGKNKALVEYGSIEEMEIITKWLNVLH